MRQLKAICDECDERVGDHCSRNLQTIARNAHERTCPIGRFGLGLGDTVAAALHATGIGPFYMKIHERVTGEPCTGCPKRQHALNVLLPNKD
jgi:hypothetical protein